jgi:hypothetical protein
MAAASGSAIDEKLEKLQSKKVCRILKANIV